jgi:hypothetical protein
MRGSSLNAFSLFVLSAIGLICARPCDARLFDISKGTVVTANSPTNGGADVALEIFGFFANTGHEAGSLLFADGEPAGFIHFVEWEMPQDTTFSRLRISGAGDGCTSIARTFDHVTVFAEIDDEMTVILDEDVAVPYVYDGACGVIVSRVMPLVTATRFRIEFRQSLSQQFGGPRVYEVEAFRFARCADPSDDDKVTATDALFTLQTSVGSKLCENCICDVNDDGGTTATDALRVLRSAVGTPDLLECPVCVPAS